jgi:predicted RNA-binding protein
MSVRYWIGVVAADHVDAAVQSGICAFSHGKKASLAKLSEGDRFAYYSPKTGYMSGDAVQCFTALGTIIDPTPIAFTWDGNEIWAAKAAYAKVKQTSVRPLLEKLKFVSNPARWGMAFRRGQFEISEVDFDLIENAMKAPT